MNERIEQGLHEKLCAYVLGESEGADRAEVERELLRSPELRAERERLENTIGAVREALAPQEVLSADARAALEQAVSSREMRVSPIAQFPWLRLAAGIGAVGLGWWIFAGTPTGRSDVMVASTESAREFGGDKLDAEGEGKKAQAELAKDERGQSLRDDKAARLSERVGYSDPAKGKIETSSARSLEGMGYSGGTTPTPKNAPAEVMLGQSSAAPTAVGSPVTPSDGLNAAVAPAQTPAPVAGRKMGTGARKGRAGGPTKPVQSAPALAQDSLPPPSSAGSYRGAGDSVAPGAGGGPALASTAPSSPGASGPSSGGLATSSDGFLSNRAPVPQEKAEERSRHGFAGDDADAASVALEEDQLIPGRKGSTWQELTSAEQASRIELRAESIYRDCFPRPNERPRDMFFRFWGDNPFEVALLDRLSTFSIDVDTASYTLARRYLNEGKVPEKAQIRTEEFLNYFAADVDAPRNATFAVHSDLTPSRFSADSARQMLRIVVRAKDVEKFERQAMHLTFVVDVSGSMQEQNRLETVKSALRMLVAQLDGRDSIALVKFGTEAQLVLPMTSVLDRVAIEQAITPLVPSGSTNSNAGLQLGYAQALMGLDPNVVNRVVFLSDGVANVGETDAAKILEGVKSIREKGIYLNTIGVGMNNHNDVLLEQLADKGDGMCNYVDSPKEIQRALVDRFTGAFQPIAKDVKIQVEFDPQQVMRYRLLGYENRAIADADFRNDAVDAGEVGAGHQVTALYEIEPTGRGGEGPMATVRLRWKPILPAGTTGVQEATEASFEVSTKSYQAFESAPPGYRRAAIVAQFAEILRRSIHARGESLDDLIQEATKLQAQIPNDADFAEFTALLLRAKDTILRSLPVCDELCQTVDALRSNIYLGAIFHETGRDPRTLEEIEQNRRELEQRLREVLRREAEVEAGVEKPRVR